MLAGAKAVQPVELHLRRSSTTFSASVCKPSKRQSRIYSQLSSFIAPRIAPGASAFASIADFSARRDRFSMILSSCSASNTLSTRRFFVQCDKLRDFDGWTQTRYWYDGGSKFLRLSNFEGNCINCIIEYIGNYIIGYVIWSSCSCLKYLYWIFQILYSRWFTFSGLALFYCHYQISKETLLDSKF